MVSRAIANLSSEDLFYLEKLLGKEFANQNERKKQFETKNGWSPNDESKKVLRLLNAIRSQRKLLTMDKWQCINKLLALKQRGHMWDSGAVPDGSTINTGMRLKVCRDSYKNGLRAEDDDTGSNPVLCVFAGAEIGFDQCESEVELTVLAYVIKPKFTIANDNRAPEMALAA